MEQVLAVAFVVWLAYFLVRFFVFEFLTITLRRVGPVRRWLQDLRARGLFRKTRRAKATFVEWLSFVGRCLRWPVSHGWLRALTFVFVAATLSFLSSLPLQQLRDAHDQYEAALRSLASPQVRDQGPTTLCAIENYLAAFEAETGHPFLNDVAHFQPYPLDQNTGRRVAAVFPQSWPALSNDALGQEIVGYCQGQIAAPTLFHPLRTLTDYRVLFEAARVRVERVLANPRVRHTYDFFAEQLAQTQLLLSLINGVLFGAWLGVALNLAGAILTRLSPKIWMTANAIWSVGASLAAAIIISAGLNLTASLANNVGPVGIGYVVSLAQSEALETRYRNEMNYVIGEFADAEGDVCAELGAASPLSQFCTFTAKYLSPWDTARREFNYDAAMPDAIRRLPMMRRALFSTLMASASVRSDERTHGYAFWQGLQKSPNQAVIAIVFLIAMLAAAPIYFLSELRWTIVKRVDRIVR